MSYSQLYSRWLRPLALMVCLGVLVGLLGFASSTASVEAQFDPMNYDPTQTITNVDHLRAIARIQGTVRVIVGIEASTPLRSLADVSLNQAVTTTQNQLLTALRGQNFTVHRQFAYIPYVAMSVDDATLSVLQRSRLVNYIGLDAINFPTMNNTTTIIGAAGSGGAWEMGYQGNGWTVAVLDTGVDKTHPALSSRVVSEACYGSNASTTDYVAQPWCPGGVDSSTAAGSGVDCNLTYAGCGHGTHVAGTVASTDATYKGVAPQANIIAIQVFSRFDGNLCTQIYGVSACTFTFTSDQIDGLNRVYALRTTYNIAAVNMSLGGGKYTNQATCDINEASRKAAIDLLRGVNIATVVASGNSGHTDGMGAPGCISTAISVGATTDADIVASFSNSVSFLDLLAPGVNIRSTVPGTNFEDKSGTSMATPHVAGAWALVKNAVPSATVSQVETALKTTGLSVLDSRNGLTFPRIRVNLAINNLLGGGATATPTATNTPNPATNTPTNTPDASTATPTITPSATSTPQPGIDLLLNGGMENDFNADKVPDDWTYATNLANDRIKCNTETKTFAHTGECAFMFRGSVGENSRLTQTVDLTGLEFIAGDQLDLSLFSNASNALTTGKVKLRVRYNDGTATGKLNITLDPTTGYAFDNGILTLASGNVDRIKLTIQNASPAGKVYVDDVRLGWILIIRRGEVIPLP